MTQDELRKRAEEIARKALVMHTHTLGLIGKVTDAMLAFREEGVAAERERCAKVCRDMANRKSRHYFPSWSIMAAKECAEAIEKGASDAKD